jgi:hypothetical protein
MSLSLPHYQRITIIHIISVNSNNMLTIKQRGNERTEKATTADEEAR